MFHQGIGDSDINHCPVWAPGEAEPDWTKVKPYNRASRCLQRASDDDPWVGNQIVGQTLRDGGMTEVARHLALQADEQVDWSLLEPTGKHGLVRVDQAHVTAALVPALVRYDRIDPGESSDHFGIEVTVDLNRIDESKLFEYT